MKEIWCLYVIYYFKRNRMALFGIIVVVYIINKIGDTKWMVTTINPISVKQKRICVHQLTVVNNLFRVKLVLG